MFEVHCHYWRSGSVSLELPPSPTPMRFRYLFRTSRACPAPSSLLSSLIDVLYWLIANFANSSRSDGVMFNTPLLLKSCNQMMTDASNATTKIIKVRYQITNNNRKMTHRSAIRWRKVPTSNSRLCRQWLRQTLTQLQVRGFELTDRFHTQFQVDIPGWSKRRVAINYWRALNKPFPSSMFQCMGWRRRMREGRVHRWWRQLT